MLILNYGSSPDELGSCVSSVLESVGAPAFEVVIGDNGSTRHPQSAGMVAGTDRRVRAVPFGRNWGFAGGVNRLIAAAHADASQLLLLNSDAALEPDALAQAVAVLDDAPERTVSVAPKMLLAAHPGVIDSVGNAVNGVGEAFNVGLGQPDIGQFDVASGTEPCFGPCFGAALFRRSAFEPSGVGPMPEAHFLYYEDVWWNWRAQLLGYDSATAPAARVHHLMSGSTRHLDYGFKFRLAERNLLTTAAVHLEPRRALRSWRRLRGLVTGPLQGHYPIPSLRAAGGAVARLPSTLTARREIQGRRIRTDEEIMRFAAAEDAPHFDSIRYVPVDELAARADAERRLARIARHDRPEPGVTRADRLISGRVGTFWAP